MISSNLEALGALLAHKWEAAPSDNGIWGRWAEDESRYYISCPEALRDLLITLQNNLAYEYSKLESARCLLAQSERSLHWISAGMQSVK